ncbi:MAG: hypothetical protein KF726_14980 [Anaerolineae bacterium]|nr:hypothetical protein [Anaerolineae bacterium]
MKTPAGKECPQYYADFHRGRNIQECRLASRNPESAPWRPADCTLCSVPDIVRANASPDMRLKLTIKSGFLGLGRRLIVEAYCEKHQLRIDDPFVGCPRCNAERPGSSAFADALENLDLPE